ncbi:uncharacterized protein B0I36DRAFT_21744 [Microdochium trichocladiopsis]|uniref:2EXR domain-containing protein n=1 Tax=Microdochium trichocladiopsis TaxID=1682393 RepID=A0A9P8YKR8_9PEZI|nr:uncharacterized protein B0I36DRAFT_21744 [Microdochium trichocladiopsis]KAH7041311.1 hypothetical protein B0I36DRAFT_21744 [Microdochium trichocladiopsis]
MLSSDQTLGTARFSRFRALPAKLRLQIWCHSNDAVGSRLIPLRHRQAQVSSFVGSSRESRRAENAGNITTATPSIPASLHVCRESRHEALSLYQKLYEPGGGNSYSFIDCSRDIVLMLDLVVLNTSVKIVNTLVTRHVPLHIETLGAASIQTLDVPQSLFSDLQAPIPPCPQITTSQGRLQAQDLFRHVLGLFPALQHIIIVLAPNNTEFHGCNEGPCHSLPAINDSAKIRERICCLSEPPVRNRYVERKLRDTISLLDVGLGQDPRTSARPTWSIKSSSCSGSCSKKLSSTASREARQVSSRASGSGLPVLPSWGIGRRDSYTPRGPRRCCWPFTEVAGTNGALDFTASRLAFYRRYRYWS